MNDNEQKRIFSDNLNRFLSACNKSQKEVADAIGISPQTFNTWCQGIAMPRIGKLQLLADYFHIEKSAFIDSPADISRTHSQTNTSIAVFDRIPSGIPFHITGNVVGTEEISTDATITAEFFGLQIHGDSMEPRFSEGDIVIARKQDDAESGDIVIASLRNEDAACRRLRKYHDGIELISNNPSYEPMFFSNEEIVDETVRILGRVVELRAKF